MKSKSKGDVRCKTQKALEIKHERKLQAIVSKKYGSVYSVIKSSYVQWFGEGGENHLPFKVVFFRVKSVSSAYSYF